MKPNLPAKEKEQVACGSVIGRFHNLIQVRSRSVSQTQVRDIERHDKPFSGSADEMLSSTDLVVTVSLGLPKPLTMGLTGCPETSVNYQSTLRNIAEERRSRSHGGGSLKLPFWRSLMQS